VREVAAIPKTTHAAIFLVASGQEDTGVEDKATTSTLSLHIKVYDHTKLIMLIAYGRLEFMELRQLLLATGNTAGPSLRLSPSPRCLPRSSLLGLETGNWK